MPGRPTPRDSHVDGPLTNVSIGYRNLRYIYPEVFPNVPVDHQSDVYYIFDKDAWFRDGAQPRAPGTKAARVDYTITTASYRALNYALAKAVTDEELSNADVPLRPLVNATQFVTDRLEHSQEIRVADIVSASGNWANASNPGTKWTQDSSDPFGDIDNLQNAILVAIGRMPNVAAMSWNVWRQLRQHPDFVDRVKHTRAGGRVETDDLRAWFGFEKVLIGTAMKETANEGATSSRSAVWGDMLWAGYVPMNAALEEPAAGYCFEWNNRQIERFREDQEKQFIIAGNHYKDEKITASDAGGGYYDVT